MGGHAPPHSAGLASVAVPPGVVCLSLLEPKPGGERERASPAGLRACRPLAMLSAMKTSIFIVILMALCGCSATPSLRVSEDGIALAVVVCPDTGECLVVSVDLIPDGWIVIDEATASAVDGFQ